MSYVADKLGIDGHTQTDTDRQTEARNDNTQRPKLASCKMEELLDFIIFCYYSGRGYPAVCYNL